MLPDLLTLGGRLTLVGGKGGVGKTTTAAALAVTLAERGRRVLVVSTDPAHSLGDALGVTLAGEPAPVPGVPGLRALEVDAERERERFLGAHREALHQLMEQGTYLDHQDVSDLVDRAVPGMDELAALLRLLELTGGDAEQVLVDTAPTGHTLRLLDLPALARGWTAALRAMEHKRQAVAVALAGAPLPDEASGWLDTLDQELARLDALLRDPAATRFVLVTSGEPVVLAETRRLSDELTARGIALAGIVVNRALPGRGQGAPGMVFVPPLEVDLGGAAGLRRFAAAASTAPPTSPAPAAAASGLTVGGAFEPPTDRQLYLVGGKGGVGKSTTAAALAVALADRGRAVLLLGVDPAGSLHEVLAQEVGPEARPVAGVPGLHVRQLDAPAAWAAFRDRYRAEAGQLFDSLLSGGASATADRAVVERLVDLAPPGLDELVALLEVVDLTEDRPYDALVLDTAPTGHLLRLLELPELALDWSHSLLRMLLKYRRVVGLGPLAERVLQLTRSLRRLRDLVADPRSTWILAVALPEALSVPETRRLLDRLEALGAPVGALLVNRLLDPVGAAASPVAPYARALLRLAGNRPVLAAPALAEGPAGVAALRGLAESWRCVGPGAPAA